MLVWSKWNLIKPNNYLMDKLWRFLKDNGTSTISMCKYNLLSLRNVHMCVCKCYPPLIVWGLFGYGHQLLSQYVCVCAWVYGHVTVCSADCRVTNMDAQIVVPTTGQQQCSSSEMNRTVCGPMVAKLKCLCHTTSLTCAPFSQVVMYQSEAR